jgi:N-acetyl-anhydromuramyl-L-alanine amidase AmpD
MNAVQLLNIYAPYFMNPTVREERGLKGKAIWSGHFRDGSQSFLAYHWLMRADGQAKRLLDDNQIGWHAGNWKINRRSIAICLDNDYSEKDPDDELLKKLADFIRQNYPQIEPMNIIGHCEAREGTACPGKNWLTNWKIKLLNYVEVK